MQRNLPLHLNVLKLKKAGGGKACGETQLDQGLNRLISHYHIDFFDLFGAPFLSVFLPLSGSQIHLERCELLLSVGNCGIFWLRAFKSPVIADQPRARYSPETAVVAMVTPTCWPSRWHKIMHAGGGKGGRQSG